jgi:tRNA dimethylallyltransferase
VGASAYALLGPTASGKSRIALEAARTRPVEIVSMDSAQVYRGMDIGTAKPTAAERAAVPHHLIDLVNPDEAYSTGRWREDAIRAVQAILSHDRIPVIVGGTMLYYRALVGGLDALPSADPALRARIDGEAARRGWPAMHAELAKVDSAAAARIGVNDAQRIQRALEVWHLAGKPLSSLQGAAPAELPFTLRAFSISPEREELKRRIAERFDAMLRAGLVDEVRELRRRYRLDPRAPSMRCVGYRQVCEYLDGEVDEAAMRDRAVAATRQLAKRQLTWMRSFAGLTPLAPGHSFL